MTRSGALDAPLACGYLGFALSLEGAMSSLFLLKSRKSRLVLFAEAKVISLRQMRVCFSH